MTLVEQPLERVDHERARARHAGGVAQASVQLRIARNQPGVGEREQELGIVGLGRVELGGLADLMAHDESGVPERMQEIAQEALLGGADVPAEEH